jgi:hypothetical protein
MGQRPDLEGLIEAILPVDPREPVNRGDARDPESVSSPPGQDIGTVSMTVDHIGLPIPNRVRVQASFSEIAPMRYRQGQHPDAQRLQIGPAGRDWLSGLESKRDRRRAAPRDPALQQHLDHGLEAAN